MLGRGKENPRTPKICKEKTPNATHKAASMAGPIIISLGDSLASFASWDLGRARKVIPKAFTKQAAARALVRANTANDAIKINSRNGLFNAADWKKAWKIMSSLTKPLKGGRAEIETAPIRKSMAVLGMRLIKPPISSMLRVPVALTMLPEVMKRRLLKIAWFRVWKRAPASARNAMASSPDN